MYICIYRPPTNRNRSVPISCENAPRPRRREPPSYATPAARTRPHPSCDWSTAARMPSGNPIIHSSRPWRSTRTLVQLVRRVSALSTSFVISTNAIISWLPGMVQVCSTCNEKHSSLAEGGPPPATSSVTHSAVGGGGIGSPSAGQSLESNSVVYSASGAIAAPFGGRNSPSEKSLANSDSMSNVRFRVRNLVISEHVPGLYNG